MSIEVLRTFASVDGQLATVDRWPGAVLDPLNTISDHRRERL